jgi:hypothetical protein
MSPEAPHGQGKIADEILVKSIVILGLLALVFLSWLGMAGLWVVALRRLGSGWSRDLRLWTRLKILEYAWLVLLLSVALLGLRVWVVLPMLIVWVALIVTRRVIRRRFPQWPPDLVPPG